MSVVRMKIATNIKSIRQANNLNQTEFAKSLNTTQQNISAYEKGINDVPIDFLIEISKKYNVSLEYIVGLDDVPTNDKDLKFVIKYTGLQEETIEFLNKIMHLNKKSIVVEENGFEWYTDKDVLRFTLKILEKCLMSKDAIFSFNSFYSALWHLYKNSFWSDTKHGKKMTFYSLEEVDSALFRITKSITNIAENYGQELFNKEFLDIELKNEQEERESNLKKWKEGNKNDKHNET